MKSLTLLAGLLLVAAAFPAAAAPQTEAPPDPTVAVSRACAAAGGLEAFKALATLSIEMSREEVTQAGSVQKSARMLYLTTPGPVPGRLEDPAVQVVAGDDGAGGWALVGGQVDTRPSTRGVIQRQTWRNENQDRNRYLSILLMCGWKIAESSPHLAKNFL